jgi:Na+-translocating ferredoxin:NAD+ oxidoreductase subunit D
MYPTQLHSYLLWRSSVDPDPQALASKRNTATVALLPVAMVGIFVFGWWAAVVMFASMIAALITDLVCHKFLYKYSTGPADGIWVLTGLLLALLMPPNVPLWLPILGSMAAIFVGKYYLSVDGMPLFKPAVVGLLTLQVLGVLTLMFSGSNPMLPQRQGAPAWPVLERDLDPRRNSAGGMVREFFGGDVRRSVTRKEHRDAVFAGQTPLYDKEKQIPAEAVHGPRPLNMVKENPGRYAGKVDASLGEGNQRYGAWEMILGYVPGTIASSALALGWGILLLIFSGAVSWVLPVVAMLTMFLLLQLLAWMYGGSSDPRIIADNIPIHLLTGTTLLGVFYLAADPATAPRSFIGKVYAGVAFGLIEVLLRIFTPLTEGIFISVIIVQSLSFVIDQWLAPPHEAGSTPPGVGLTSSSLGRL